MITGLAIVLAAMALAGIEFAMSSLTIPGYWAISSGRIQAKARPPSPAMAFLLGLNPI